MGAVVNCWDYQKCGKQDECPAYPNFGKTCFSVSGTYCRGAIQGAYKEKIQFCRKECDFYKEVVLGA